MATHSIESFYHFQKLSESSLEDYKSQLEALAETLNIQGLLVLGTEGANGTLSSTNDKLPDFLKSLETLLGFPSLQTKTSSSSKPPFKRFSIKVRKEIVTLDRPDIVPGPSKKHLTPEAWDQMLADSDSIVVDTRNLYETQIGKFKNAVDLEIDEFTDFPEKMKAAEWDKDKNYLIYCTGGIRCEKAIYSMEEMGFKNVFQLDGGILNYLKEKPEGHFEGECFVFDSRVAVDKNLQPSQQYSLCPHCGDVGDQDIRCLKCDGDAKVCSQCLSQSPKQPEMETCSKNCAYHYKRDPNSKSPQQRRHFHGQHS